jgi:septum formation protein
MALWLAEEPLLVASKSASRRALLEAAGIPIEVCPADIDERGIEDRAALDRPEAVAALLAREKARAVAALAPRRLVLGADQTLALGLRRFSKARDRAEARAQLAVLRGGTHVLHSAVAVVRGGTVLFQHVAAARMTMRNFSDGFLDDYLDAAGAAACTSVGGYQLEGLGVQLFKDVAGDHATILGLPLLPLLQFLREEGCLAA